MSNSDSAKEELKPDPAISRRDFLRRAGKEAAYTGTKLVPGAAIAEKVLGISRPGDQTPGTAAEAKKPSGSLIERLASWRRGHRDGDSTPE